MTDAGRAAIADDVGNPGADERRRLIRNALSEVRRVQPLGQPGPTDGVFSYRAFFASGEPSLVIRVAKADTANRTTDTESELLASRSSHLVAHSYQLATDPVTSHTYVLSTRPYYRDVLSSYPTERTSATTSWLRRWDTRTRIVQDLLESLVQIHESGRHYRGGINEDNVGIDTVDKTAVFVDWDEIGIADDAPSQELQAKDVIQFSQLAQRLLDNRVWDNRTEIKDASLRTDRFEWVLEYCSLVEPGEAPSAKELADALFGNGELLHKYSHPAVHNAYSSLMNEIQACLLDDREGVKDALDIAVKRLRRAFRADPVTRIAAIPNEAIDRVLARLTIDQLGRKLRGVEAYSKSNGKWHVAPINHENFNPDPDESQLARVAQMWENDGLPYETADLEAHQSAMANMRRSLLLAAEFIYTDALASVLAVPRAPMLVADVVALRHFGAVLAVPDHGRWLYPVFQLDPKTGAVSDLILRAHDVMTDNDTWDMLGWWLGSRTVLNGGTFAEVLHTVRGRKLITAALSAL